MKNFPSLKFFKREKGQVLLFVLLIVFVLLFILFGIILIVRTDIRETLLEREYESGYAMAEEELSEIGSKSYEEWQNANPLGVNRFAYTGSFCPSPGEDGCSNWTCERLEGAGANGQGTVIIKRCLRNSLEDMTISQDETLEVSLLNASGNPQLLSQVIDSITISWEGASAVVIIVVYDDTATPGTVYESRRVAMCRTIAGCYTGFIAHPPNPFNLVTLMNLDPADVGFIMRIRAIGANATNVDVDEDNLGPQVEIIRSQALPEGWDPTQPLIEGKELSAPEVWTEAMIGKSVPSLFDYVLFVSNGGVTKP